MDLLGFEGAGVAKVSLNLPSIDITMVRVVID
jgi:hypothetical protein